MPHTPSFSAPKPPRTDLRGAMLRLWAWVQAVHWRWAGADVVDRFVAQRVLVTAGSLTFTTVLSLVPMVTVMLAVFTLFPAFAKMQAGLEVWLTESLVPDAIARQVQTYVGQFAGRANRLGVAGLAVLALTAVALLFTIERTLNALWRSPRPRAFSQRLLMVWAVLTGGPLLLAAAVGVLSWLSRWAASKGAPGGFSVVIPPLIDGVELLLLAGGLAALYRWVPNARVSWPHAWLGGLLAALAIEIAKVGLGLYLRWVPTYATVYGALAVLPILLVWIYSVWLLVLLGAVVVASAPGWTESYPPIPTEPGGPLALGLALLQALGQARDHGKAGLALPDLARQVAAPQAAVQPVVAVLQQIDWVGLLDEPAPQGAYQSRYVLLVDAQHTPAAPMLQRLLADGTAHPALQALLQRSGWAQLTLADLLQDLLQNK
jgi:membrane protein